jgi:hypothetical protein
MIVTPALRSVSCSGFMGFLALTTMMFGCVGTRVEYFTDETYPARSQVKAIEWLAEAPTFPYLELARITVRSTNAGEEKLRHSLLDRARRLGADAVIPETPVVVASAGPTPYYEPGILGPSGAAFGLYGYGWYSPYSSNPYILVQGAVDQPRTERYLSAIAIRYQDKADPARVP